MFSTALYISLFFAAAGIVLKIYRFHKQASLKYTASKQTHKFFEIKFTSAFFNTILQTKLFKASKTRWAVHFLVLSGFIYLLLFHALADLTSVKLFKYYEPTVDPFQFLRNFAGFIVILGCCGFLLKKFLNIGAPRNIKGKFQNLFSIFLILLIIFSGFMLEAVKIISEPVFMEMVEDYAGIDEDSGLDELKIYWEKEYNVIFQETLITSEEALEEGQALNEEYCLDCHSKISSAFVSKKITQLLNTTGQFLNHYRADNYLYHIHYLLSFLMLITLPFTRMFHILLIPFASLRQKTDAKDFQKQKTAFNLVTLDACTDCMLCSQVCSVYPNFVISENIKVLPHSKIQTSRKMMAGVQLGQDELNNLLVSNSECTMCNNCTNICPSQIDLQALWMTISQTTLKRDKKVKIVPRDAEPVFGKTQSITSKQKFNIIPPAASFKNCVQCTICTNVCPIVEYASTDENDMTPQQIMNLLRLGKDQIAAKTQMVHNCLTCYSCQENCPGEIKVTDIMIELRQVVTKC